MALTHVQLYEALKPSVGEEAARLMAEVVPAAENLATKSDLAEGFAQVRAEIHAESTRTIKWFLGVFLPILAGTWGTVVAVLMKS